MKSPRLLLLLPLLVACSSVPSVSSSSISLSESTSSESVSSSDSGAEPALTESESTSEESSSEATSSETSTQETTSETSSETSSEQTSSEETSSGSSTQESSSSASSSGEGGYAWNVDLSLFGKPFLVSLGIEINATRKKTTTYSECLSIGAKAAAYPNENSSTFIPFYHEAKDSEKTTTGSCNREHTWPNSRGGGKKAGGGNIENDPIMVRPTLTSDNSDRANYFYGTSGKSGSEWDPASCGYEGARGESARVILYVVTCYAESNGVSLSNNPKDATSSKTMGTLSTLLEWNRRYPPTEFEKTVNERYYKMGYARNAFVDHPEFADYIYDENGFRTSAYVA